LSHVLHCHVYLLSQQAADHLSHVLHCHVYLLSQQAADHLFYVLHCRVYLLSHHQSAVPSYFSLLLPIGSIWAVIIWRIIVIIVRTVLCCIVYHGWWHGTVVERQSLAGELSLVCARPASDEWSVIWVNCLLQVSQLGQLSLSSFWGRLMSSKLQSISWWRHLVNAYRVKAWCG